MKRTDITELFPDATKEAIDKLMGINGADINASKNEVEGIRKQLTDKADADLEEKQKQIEQLTRDLDRMQRAESIRLLREKVAGDKKIPAHLLTEETEEACAKQADAILAFAQTSGYPSVKDGGEAFHGTAPKTRDAFADWARENL